MLGFNVFAADTDEEATLCVTSQQQAFVNLRSGTPGKLPPPKADFLQSIGPQEHALLASVRQSYAIGSIDTVRREMNAFIERTGADELMIAGQIYDHDARLRSYEITAELQRA
jgi:alkanesulfonate monooxygenase SsuD/methylene tetrahydromethanopterin reductase-like flavin-dependent oxidoreductase (luciferase family)